ncbi:MAG: two-component regulator propeller domain-containing protein [Bacteroidota bacterium]|nr:ATP-binding protein [Candidatus Kapabacteria bacterium]MDW8220020.1 two-component regulator propeller domain-containing protein [Bacteroidota bacterium]
MKHGLSQGTVLCMLQDKRGFMWFGTEDGLNRWDGHTFKIFRNNPRDSTSLVRNYIEALYEDKEGTLWVGTKGGLCRFNRTTETFTTFYADGKEYSLSKSHVTAIVDDARGEYLWVGTYGGGLCRMDKRTGKFTTYRKATGKKGALWSDVIMRLTADKRGEIWIGTYDGGLYRYVSADDTFQRFYPDTTLGVTWKSVGIEALWADRLGRIWIGTNNLGLLRFEYRPLSQNGEFVRFVHTPVNPAALPSPKVSAVLETKTGELWVGTGNGLALMNRALETFTTYHHERTEPESLVNDEVLSLYEDRDGTVWVGTRSGINFFHPRAQKFLTYRAMPNQAQGLSNNAVWAFAEDKQGKIWIGTEDGLNRMESNPLAGGSGVFEVFRANDVFPNQLEENFISALCVARDGTLWIGTDKTGLYALRQTYVYGKATFEHYVAQSGEQASLPNNAISKIIEDRDGKIWVATYGGVARLESIRHDGTAVFTTFRYTNPADSQSLIHPIVLDIHQDHTGMIWVGTERGISCIHPSKGTVRNYRPLQSRLESLSDNAVQCVYEDRVGRIWLGTEGGLKKFDPTTGQSAFVDPPEHADNKLREALRTTILGIQEENTTGILWLSTNHGLIRFNPQTGDMLLYDERDGLQGDEFIVGAAFKSRTGAIFFGGTNGFSVFHPDSLRAVQTVPAVVFTGFTSFNRPIPLDTVISEKRHVVLKYDENNFELRFAALSFRFAERHRYRYKLEGFDNDWHYLEPGQFDARYTNIEPGEYVFRVQACTYENSWDEAGTATIAITIVPPFWVTWWFRALMAISIVGGGLGFITWRIRSIQERNKILEELVNQRTRELQASNEEIKTQFQEIQRQNAILDQQAAEIEMKNSELQEAYIALKNSEEQRMLERAHLAQAEKMASLGRLTNSVAHEINNPVNFISGAVKPLKRNIGALVQVIEQYSAIVPSKLNESELASVRRQLQEIMEYKEEIQLETRLQQIDDLVNNIGIGAERIAEIVKSLRTLYRPEEDALKTASIHEGIDATIKLLYNQSKYHHIVIKKHYGADVPEILCYPGPLNQVFMNILHNAIQAIGNEKGEIHITTSLQNGNPNNVVVSIRDTGRGMDAATLGRIFEAGFTTKKDGMGIGLAISRDIVENKHKGMITVKSELGVGTEFQVVLPVNGPRA